MPSLDLYDAVDLGTLERLRRFRSVVSEIFVQDWDLSSPDLLPERMWLEGDSSAEGLAIVRGYAQPMSATSVVSSASRRKIYFALTSNRPYRVVAPNHDVSFAAGEVVVLSNMQPCSVICTKSHLSSAFIIDSESIEARIGDIEPLLGRHLLPHPDTSAVLLHLMDLAWRFSSARALDRAALDIKRAVLDQLALVALLSRIEEPLLAATISESRPKTAAQVCRERVTAFIDEHYHNPDLTIASLSVTLAVSSRTVQLAFAQCSDTASAYLRRKRMATAAAMLRSVKLQQSTVTTIAYACGFNSASHFTTEFHRAFGMAPTTFRHAECIPSHCLDERLDK